MTNFRSILSATIVAAAALIVIVSPTASAATGDPYGELQASVNASLQQRGRPTMNWINVATDDELANRFDNPNRLDNDVLQVVDQDQEQYAKDHPLSSLHEIGSVVGGHLQQATYGKEFDISSFAAMKQQECYAGVFAQDYMDTNNVMLTDFDGSTIEQSYTMGLSDEDNQTLRTAYRDGLMSDMSACDGMLVSI